MIALSDLQPNTHQALSYPTFPVPAPTGDDSLLYPHVHQFGRQPQDEAEFVRMLTNDQAFVNAVRNGDVSRAAQTSFHFYQQHAPPPMRMLQDERDAAHMHYMGMPWVGRGHGDTEEHMHMHAWHHRRHVMEPVMWQREIRPGDWVVIQGVKKASDSELLGHHAQVQAAEEGGMVELAVPKLGMTARLHHRYLAPLHMGIAHGPGDVMAGGHYPRRMKDRRQHQVHTPAGGGTTGEASTDSADDAGPTRAPRRHKDSDNMPRVVSLGQPLLPARVGTLLGRGVCKARDVAKAVRKEVLTLEEVVPWDLVEAGWRNKRTMWQRSLRALDVTKSVEAMVPMIAGSLLEIHEALLTDKTGAGPTPILARGGAWEQRLQELAAGGNSYQCLQQVWDEMHEAVRVWLLAHGRPLPYTSPAQLAPPPPPPHQQQQQGPPPPTPGGHAHGFGPTSSRTFDRNAYSLVLKAVTALQAGVAATDTYLALGQLAVDRVIALGREASAALRALLLAAEEVSLGPALEALASACDLPALLGVTPGEMDKLSDADVVCLMLVSPAVRAELCVLHSIDSEPDTDVELGSDVTDMDE